MHGVLPALQVRHYCVPNQTDKTRVSLDLRVIALKRFNHDFVDKRGRKMASFRIGEYYTTSAMDSDDGLHA